MAGFWVFLSVTMEQRQLCFAGNRKTGLCVVGSLVSESGRCQGRYQDKRRHQGPSSLSVPLVHKQVLLALPGATNHAGIHVDLWNPLQHLKKGIYADLSNT